MKILIVRTFPNFLDAAKYNIQEIGLAKALVKAGHEVGIVLYNGKNEDTIKKISVQCENEIREIVVYYLHGWNFFKNGIFPSLKKVVDEYEVIQVHEYDQITSWLYYAWSKKRVVIYHGPYYDKFNKGYNFKCKVFDNIFLRFKHNKNTPCLTKSHAAAEFLRTKGFQNVTAVGVGLDADNFSTAVIREEEKIEVEKDKFTIIYVGKIEERRNSLFLSDVMREITTRYEDVRCIVVGNGEKAYTEAFMTKMEPLIKAGKVRYFSSATQVQLADLYQKASLMLFPSNYEIFGMVLAEAVYFGLPVVSTLNGGSDMLIKNNAQGHIVSTFEMEDWIKGIELFYYKDKRDGMSDAVISQNGKEYLWDGICKKILEVYSESNA